MAEGIEVEVADGFARIQFHDTAKKGPTLTRLLELGGPGLIDVDTRSGRRKTYIVPESIAKDAGLLDDVDDDGDQPDRPMDFPETEPTESWTVPQLRAYAKYHEIDLGGAMKKPDILTAVTTPEQPADSPSPSVLTPVDPATMPN